MCVHDVKYIDAHDVENIDAHDVENIDAHDVENIDAHDVENIDAHDVENIDTHDVENIDAHDVENIDAHDVENIDAHDVENIDAHDVENIDAHNVENIDAHDVENIDAHDVSQEQRPPGMGKGYYLSKNMALAGLLLAAIALVTIIVLSVVYDQERSRNRGPIGDGPPGSEASSSSSSTATPSSSSSTPPPGPPEPWQRYRLPDTLAPVSYRITLWPRLQPDQQGLFIFTGNSTVEFLCLKDTDLILIHANKLNFTLFQGHQARLAAPPGDPPPPQILRSWLEVETEYLVLRLDGMLVAGLSYLLHSQFQGELGDNLEGFYRSQYTEDGVHKVLATSQMQATFARQAFPCFDEPALKATFSVVLTHPPGTIALSNSREMESVEMELDGVSVSRTTFEPTKRMSTYLLAFIVSNFTFIEAPQDSEVQVRIWGRGQAIARGHGDYALNVTGAILNFYERYYNTSYPLSKSDQVALPDFSAGAMENWGLVTYRETALLYDPSASSTGNKERVTSVVSHELAHMWFGNLVTLRWWNDLWLNEGFASYVSYLGVDHAEPSWDIRDHIVLFDVHKVFAGAAVLRMLSEFLSEPVFAKGLSSYLNTFAFSNTVYTDLWNHLQQAVDSTPGVSLPHTVEDIMNRWVLQMGYPVVTVDTRTGRISQKHFLLDPEAQVERASPYNHMILQEGDGWLLANTNVSGYFRVNYDLENWERLLTLLHTDHQAIPIINRAQLMDDAFNLARAKVINTTLALRLTAYLARERDYIPWEAALGNLNYYFLMFDRTDVYGPLQAYIRKQILPLFEYFRTLTANWTQVPQGHNDQYNQINAIGVACNMGVKECRELAQRWFFQWMADPEHNPIHPNLKTTVYCNALAFGGAQEWDFAWRMFQNATVATESARLRLALACTKAPWLLNRYLQYTLDPTKIRKQDATSTIQAVARNVVGMPLAWNFVREKWSYIFKQYGRGSFSFSGLISGITKRFSTEFELQELKSFKEQNLQAGFGSATLALEQAIEKTQANIRWLADTRGQVLAWLSGEARKAVAAGAALLSAGALVSIFTLSVLYAQEKTNQEPAPSPTTDTSTGTTPPPGPPEPWQRYRLPDTLAPISYRITLWPRLQPDQQGLFIFKGNSTVEFLCLKDTDLILIHANKLNFALFQGHRARLAAPPGDPPPPAVRDAWLEAETQYLVVRLEGSLKADRTYLLLTQFVGELADDLGGFYRSTYTEDGQEKILATTQMEPTDARKAFPCFDEPAMKAVFHLTLLHPTGTVALSNSISYDPANVTVDGQLVTETRFQATELMSTYLLAFVVCEFDFISSPAKAPVLIRIWARKQAIAEGQGDYALQKTGPILNFFEKYYSSPYPLSKSDQVALPDFSAGAMENWGLITYRETALLYNQAFSSNADQEWVVTVISHELAHMWFGNLVTMRWWNDLWLNEGFATYVSYLGADAAEPTWNIKDLLVVNEVHRVMAVDALTTSHPLSSREEETYLDTFKYNNTVSSDLWKHLQVAVDRASPGLGLPASVEDIMNRWVLQMGYPVVTVDTRTGRISQKHFLLDPEVQVERASPYNYEWIVPISWMKSGAVQDPLWLTTKEATNTGMITGSTDWLLVNLKTSGFYRDIPEINRAQLISDAFNLARAQLVNTTLALRTTLFLVRERGYTPWLTASRNLNYYFLMFDRSGLYGPMQAYMVKQVTPLFDHFRNLTGNWSKIPDTHTDQIHPNLRSAVYCGGIAAGGQAEWDFAWRMYKNTNIASEARKLLSAMACSQKPWILTRYLQYCLDPVKVRKQDAATVINSIAANALGQPPGLGLCASQLGLSVQRVSGWGSTFHPPKTSVEVIIVIIMMMNE
ncbi:hypothetical protein CRUP_016766 [Coryphaenoides rupestris]|nr:hypothetical protein CRUP_016766 [Coryphaenoides rupestris]